MSTIKTPITPADLLNDRVLPFFTGQSMGVIHILTDRGTEYCGKPGHHDYQLYLALNDIEHSKTKANIGSRLLHFVNNLEISYPLTPKT